MTSTTPTQGVDESIHNPNNMYREVKLNPPTPFNGDRKKYDDFIIEAEMYLSINSDIFDTDKKKILFTLSYMREGTAGPWKQSYWTTNGAVILSVTWNTFKKTLEDAFKTSDKIGDAISKMATERMGSKTADEHVEDFKVWKTNSKVTEDAPLIEWFMQGLPTSLRDKILGAENPPTTIDGWFTTASRFDNQWRRAKAISQRLRGGYEPKKFKIHKPTPPPYHDPNAMEVDRMTDKERDDHMKKGLCFRCHQSGHRANTCPTKSGANQTRQNPPPKTSTSTDAYARIRAIYNDLNEEEQKKLTTTLEDSGF